MNYKTILSGLLVCSLAAFTLVADAAPINNMRTSVSPARVRIVLDSKAPITYKQDKNGLKLTVNMPDSSVQKQQAKINDMAIKSIKLVPNGRNASKLQIDLKKDCQYKIYQLKGPNRLVVDIFRINIIKQTSPVAQGVTYTYMQDEMNGKQIQAYLVSVAPNAPYALLPFSAAGTYNGRGSVAKQAAQRKIPAAINASYFDTDGWVIGSIRNQNKMMAADSQPRSGFGMQAGKPIILQDIAYTGILQMPGGRTLKIKGMNRARIADDLVVYNSFYAPSTKTNNFGREIKIKNNRVIAVSTAGNMSIEPGTVVVSGHGASAAAMAMLRVGDKVNLDESLGNIAADAAETVVSGGPLLLQNGKVSVRTVEENIAPDIAKGRAPRTAVALKRDGTLMMLVVDGRSNTSSGLTLPELAQYLLRLGAVDAVNFDGGGSSVMSVNGKIVNNPSDGRERLVSIGLGLFTKW